MATRAVIDQISMDADEESAKIMREAEASGFEIGKLGETGTKQGADIIVTLHHAFSGREWRGPIYMTTGAGGAMSLTKYRFSKDDVEAVGADPKWIGKRVWYSDPQPVEGNVGNVLCRFSTLRSDEDKAALEAKGFRAFCNNDTPFMTEAAEDLHSRMRHPKWYAFMEKKEASENTTKAARSQEVQTAALVAMLEQLTTKDK